MIHVAKTFLRTILEKEPTAAILSCLFYILLALVKGVMKVWKNKQYTI